MNNKLNIIIFLFFLFFVNYSFSKNIYETQFHHIEVVTNNASESKLEEINKIKIKSFKNILDKILVTEDKNNFFKKILLNNNLDKIIQNIIIENELIIKDKYIADIKVNFEIKSIINLLRNFKINYSDIVSKSFLVLSTYSEDFFTTGLTSENIFYNNASFRLSESNFHLIKLKFPDLSPNDRFIIPYKKINSYNIKSLSKISDKYKMDRIILIIINKSNDNYLDIKISTYEKKTEKIVFIGNLYLINDIYLHNNIFLYLSNWWKKENLIDNKKINKIICTIQSKNFSDLNKIKSKIYDLSQFKLMNMKTIQYNNNIEEIEYYGEYKIFAKSLSLKDINIDYNENYNDNCVISSLN